MTDHPDIEKKEDSLAAEQGNWRDRKEQAAEHPPTGAPKKGSLLRALAEEALAKGNPVLVIPLDAADPESEPSGSEDEPTHDLKLPKNTTVIFSGKESLPALSCGDPRDKARVVEKSGDLGEQARKSYCSSGPVSPATPVRIVDPEDPDSSQWNPLSGEENTAHNVIFTSSGEGKVYSQGKRKAEGKRLSLDQVGHLKRSNGSEQSR